MSDGRFVGAPRGRRRRQRARAGRSRRRRREASFERRLCSLMASGEEVRRATPAAINRERGRQSCGRGRWRSGRRARASRSSRARPFGLLCQQVRPPRRRLLRPLEVVEAARGRQTRASLARRVRLPLLESASRWWTTAPAVAGRARRRARRRRRDAMPPPAVAEQRRQHGGERDGLERPHAHRRPLVEVDDVRLLPQRLVEEERGAAARAAASERRAEQPTEARSSGSGD